MTSSGNLFWSGPKRCPKPLVFDADDQLHFDFVCAAANLRAENYGLQGTKDADEIKSILKQVNVPEFQPKSGVKIAVTDAEAQVGQIIEIISGILLLLVGNWHPSKFDLNESESVFIGWGCSYVALICWCAGESAKQSEI